MATRGFTVEDGHTRVTPEWPIEIAARARATTIDKPGAEPWRRHNTSGSTWRPPTYPLPRPYTGIEPGNDRGMLFAADPNNPSVGDALLFAYYPTQLVETLGAQVASEDVPGRAMPVVQRMGGRGAKFSLELFFYDAFLFNPIIDDWVNVNRRIDGFPAPQLVPDGPRRDLASTARAFFEVYVVGHDGTGAALPPVETFLLWGGVNGSQAPIRVMITDVQMVMEHFDRAGNPQSVQAKVEMLVYEPTYLIHPFKPRKRQGGKKKQVNRCPGLPPTLQIFGLTTDPILDGDQAVWVAEAVKAGAAFTQAVGQGGPRGLQIDTVTGKAR